MSMILEEKTHSMSLHNYYGADRPHTNTFRNFILLGLFSSSSHCVNNEGCHVIVFLQKYILDMVIPAVYEHYGIDDSDTSDQLLFDR